MHVRSQYAPSVRDPRERTPTAALSLQSMPAQHLGAHLKDKYFGLVEKFLIVYHGLQYSELDLAVVRP